jgi:hypothetical protein
VKEWIFRVGSETGSEIFASQVGSWSKTQRKMGSGSEKNSFGSTAMQSSLQSIFNVLYSRIRIGMPIQNRDRHRSCRIHNLEENLSFSPIGDHSSQNRYQYFVEINSYRYRYMNDVTWRYVVTDTPHTINKLIYIYCIIAQKHVKF